MRRGIRGRGSLRRQGDSVVGLFLPRGRARLLRGQGFPLSLQKPSAERREGFLGNLGLEGMLGDQGKVGWAARS